jgi:hypothetical protein
VDQFPRADHHQVALHDGVAAHGALGGVGRIHSGGVSHESGFDTAGLRPIGVNRDPLSAGPSERERDEL